VDKPRVSIITSLYDGDEHIQEFIEDIVKQTYFSKCELIIVDGASPGNEKEIIEEYSLIYNNIKYFRLDKDPGIYGCWNYGIQHSQGEYITNANLDDKRAYNQIEKFVELLDTNPGVDLVYSYSFVTNQSHENFYRNSSGYQVYPTYPFTKEAMIKCLPGCQPVWRRSIHGKAGLFDTSYKYAGDWEMWLRAVRNGCSFQMIEGVYGIYYMNPEGLSTSKEHQVDRFKEEQKVFWEYTDVYGPKVTEAYSEYFSK
jgi:glycosyltransferase involved in cell wall biosynthesis